MFTRRKFVQNASLLTSALTLSPPLRRAFAQAHGNFFHNPLMGGDHPDPSPLRVGDDFFLTHSSFNFAPGLVIYHSRDLVNWRPVGAALRRYYGNVWAPYLCEYDGHFYIYFPADHRIMVVHAEHPAGPWSEPIDLHLSNIDPGHIAENGRRFLYMAGGQMAELTDDGLAVKTPPRSVFQPWPVPKSMRIECTCLEAPKLAEHNGYFYLNVAEGGTAGPGTSHMVVSARSRHADGPWEFSPYNPIVHTPSRDDRWLSLGHGRLVDTPDGKWYITVHSYENGYRSLGRQIMLLPIAWTSDGWFRQAPGITAASAIPMPIPGSSQRAFLDPSDDFIASELGLQWAFWSDFDPARFQTGKGFLTLAARGRTLEDTSPLTTTVGGHSYSVEADVEIRQGCESGLLLFYSPQAATGLVMNAAGIAVRTPTGSRRQRMAPGATRATLRIVNDRQEVDFYYQLPTQPWQKAEASVEISGMQHNVLGGFLGVRPALCATGTGSATIRNFRYWPKAISPL
ncbi:MAG: family 43 glycosylhydrolase [Terracidiphilus sp.]|nr:family 43 glycosylhydrolase [Terracidiphilus sp.]